tara:strand:- start:814 stop:1944 length:1131 start_codon:yes stop_codon:yes gene_type:complete
MNFELKSIDKKSSARAGIFYTDHGEIKTPIFMPVGTSGAVKSMYTDHLISDSSAQIILGNTYHLYLRPGTEIIKKAGGLHKFITWEKPMLTDSGGFQVHSLQDIRKISEEGVTFQSHIDGSKHMFTPESVMEIQRKIGADIVMAFDECTNYPCQKNYAEEAMNRTHRWLDRCIKYWNTGKNYYGYEQTLFPIVQGSTYSDLRKESAEYIAKKEAFGNAIGGLSVGEPAEEMYAMTSDVCSILPEDKPRYLMGVGTPTNLLENIALGIDMFDCVMPTRNARNGQLFTSEGIINIKNAKWADDFSSIDPSGDSIVDNHFSKAYLRHLFVSNESLGKQIASLHNLRFYLWLVEEARNHIILGDFTSWKARIIPRLGKRL